MEPDGDDTERVFARLKDEQEAKKAAAPEGTFVNDYRQYVAALLHDVKAPLQGTNHVLRMMAEGKFGPLSDELAGLLHQIQSSNSQLIHLLDNASEVERLERKVDQITLENVDLVKSLRICTDEYRPILQPRHVELICIYPEHSVVTLGNGLALYRLWHNLLNNAFKFVPEGGRIEVRLNANSDDAVIEVEDDGPGIATADQERLFKRFKQGKMGKISSSGTGMGLYVCKEIVELHGGKLAVRSEEGKGTCFIVTLPRKV